MCVCVLLPGFVLLLVRFVRAEQGFRADTRQFSSITGRENRHPISVFPKQARFSGRIPPPPFVARLAHFPISRGIRRFGLYTSRPQETLGFFFPPPAAQTCVRIVIPRWQIRARVLGRRRANRGGGRERGMKRKEKKKYERTQRLMSGGGHPTRNAPRMSSRLFLYALHSPLLLPFFFFSPVFLFFFFPLLNQHVFHIVLEYV